MKQLKFIKRFIELAGKIPDRAIKILKVIWKPPDLIRVRPACLTTFIALNGFALALVVFLALFSKNSWDMGLPKCPECRTAPSILQIQVLGDSDSSTRDVMVDPEKNPWVGELINGLQQIQQAMDNDDSSVSSLVVDPKENPWIDKLINALRDAGERQFCAPDAGANPISAGNNKPERQARNPSTLSEGKNSTCDVMVDLEKPSWVDDLVNALHGVVEFYAVDPAIRADVKQHLKCDGGKRLSVSGLIRFRGGEHSLNDDAAKDRIDNFVAGIDKQASRWGVFGFASESGEKREEPETFLATRVRSQRIHLQE